MMKNYFILVLMLAASSVVYSEEANGLKQAEVTAVVNDVSITNPLFGTTTPAKIKDVVSGKTAVNTGAKSRAELMFNDKTLARLGANTTFTFEEGTRNMDLKNGNMLLQVPKGAGGATIRTAAVTAAITGTTVMIEHHAGQQAKVIVLEGTLRLYMNNNLGESILIKPGQMIFMDPKSNKIPEPVNIDLKTLVGTSGLVNGVSGDSSGGTGGTTTTGNLHMELVQNQINVQEQFKANGGLSDTSLVILGEGGDVVVGNDELMTAIQNMVNATGGEKYSKPVLITDSALATIDANTTINTSPNAAPDNHTLISRNTSSAQGGYYNQNSSEFEPPLQYLGFGAASAFDDAANFNSADMQDDKLVVAGFTFVNNVSITGQPIINMPDSDSAKSVAFIAMSGTSGNFITVNGTLNMPTDLALITQNGDIGISSPINMNGNELFAYARGTVSDITLSGLIDAGGGNVNFNAEENVTINSGGITNASRFEAKAGGDFNQAGGTINAQDIEIKAGLVDTASTATIRALDISNASTGWPSYIRIEAPHIDFQNSAALDFQNVNYSELIAGAGGISANYGIMGFDYMESGGNISVTTGNLGAGTIFAKGTSNISASGYIVSPDVICNGTITANGLQVQNLSGAAIVTLGTGGIQPHVYADSSTEHILYAKSISTSTGTIYGFDQIGNPGVDGFQLEVHVQDPISLSNLATTDINFRGGNDTLGLAGNGGTFKLYSDGNLTANRNIYAHPGLSTTDGQRGLGGTVELQGGGTLTTSNTIYTGLNSSYLASGGGMISLKSLAGSGTGIQVQNSTQLRALTEAVPTSGATIALTSNQGGQIVIDGSTGTAAYLEASQTTPGNLSKILLDTLNTSGSSGYINLSATDGAYKIQLLADMIRIRSGADLTLTNARLTASEIRLLAANVMTFNTGVELLGPSGAGNIVYLSAPTINFNSQVTTAASGTIVNYYTTGTAPTASNFTGSVTLKALSSAPSFNP